MGVAFDPIVLNEGFFGANKINYGGNRVIYGTDDGLFISNHRETSKHPLKVLVLRTVRQVDVLGNDQLLVVRSGRQVLTLPLNALDHIDPTAGLKSAARITSSASLFKVGFCLGRLLGCVIKVEAFRLSTTVKVLELVGRELRIFREFYIPLESVHFTSTERGAARREFLVCWDGTPTGFALRPPYVLAFTSSCVEVWHIETGAQVQAIPGVNVRLLCEGARPSNIAEKYTDGATLQEVLMVSGDSVLVLRSVSDNV
ncbi:hypothetical protein DFH08DRAFT_964551 [Mycena albidolilacea]|uniref:CNH domain-containing protein n=1 Tax=Mycena albidolilacea TaxID=1033008 RepID=A0AAD6ZT16_9AGAR|nr:hypothetical protein DFH08DRAFT_964551 [Mycena albidolilacea]